MNLGVRQSIELAKAIAERSNELSPIELWVAPSFTSLAAVAEALADSRVEWGAQNVHWAETGAFTGEIAPGMLTELSCSFTITGHSERRNVFGESPEESAQRSIAALQAGLKVIFCIGESEQEREKGSTNSVLEAQLQPLFSTLPKEFGSQLLIAYEPVWAIGTGKVASLEEISDAHNFVSGCLDSRDLTAPILYGGSVNPSNFAAIAALPKVDGALVGGASLKAESFLALAEIALKSIT